MSAPSPTPTPLQIGLVLFPKVTQLDFTGPLQVFATANEQAAQAGGAANDAAAAK